MRVGLWRPGGSSRSAETALPLATPLHTVECVVLHCEKQNEVICHAYALQLHSES